jgi:branched-chain amino acid transport system permease protein
MTRNKITKLSSLAALIVLLLFLPRLVGGNQYLVSVVSLAAINILLVASLRNIFLLGEISLGQVGFALIGSYGGALLVMKADMNFWAALMLSGLLAAAVALVLGYPFLKVKGIYFAILTLMTAETFRLVAYYWRELTGGTLGLVNIPPASPMTLPFIGTIKFTTLSNYYYIVIIVVLICLFIMYLLERSHVNFRWRAIKDADELALSVGINVIWYKMMNFAIACFFAGISGALFAFFQRNLSADGTSRFGIIMSIYLLVYMVVGGHKYFVGPIIGTLVLTLLSELARPMQNYKDMFIGLIAILVMIFMPNGLTGLPSQIRYWLWKIKRLRQARLMKQNKEAPNSSPTST